jgi:hypothetical protein
MFTDHIHDQLGKYRVGVISDFIPDFVKQAEETIVSEDITKLADGAFAYSDGINRYFPLHTPEHTWFSHYYFEKFASQIEEPLRQEIQGRIQDAFTAFNLPENSMVKIAAEEDEIDALHVLSMEMNKFIDNYKKLSVADRRIKAKEILHKAFSLGHHNHMHEMVKRYAADNLHKNYERAFMDRMRYFHHGTPERESLLGMQEEAPKHVPENVAKALLHFDHKTGLEKMYDNELDDPFLGLLDFNKGEEEPFICGEHKILPSHLKNFDYNKLDGDFENDFIEKLKADPIHALHEAPEGVKIIVIRRINHG